MVTTEYYARPVTLDDLKFAGEGTDVYNSAYNTHDGWTTEAAIVGGKLTTRQDTEKLIEDSVNGFITQLFVFQRNDQGNDTCVVGTLTIVPFPDLEETPTPGEAMITRFALSPKHQSKGLGRLLIEASLDVMKEQGYARCSLRVFENRPEVLGWYARLGFKDTLERRAYRAPEGKTLLLQVGFVIMKLDL